MLYTHATIITVDPARRIIEDGAIYVRDNIIADLDATSVLRRRYPHEREYDLSGHVAIPGLISTHMHTIQALLRGTADNQVLGSWLEDIVRPLQYIMTAEEASVAVQLSVAEMLKSGTTCFLESMFLEHHDFDQLCRVVQDSGIRGCLARRAPLPAPANNATDRSIANVVQSWRRWNGAANDRIRVWFGALTPGLTSDDRFKEMTAVAHSHGIPITIHCAESQLQYNSFASHGHTPVSWAESVGLLSPSTVLAHMVHLDKINDIPKLAASGAHIAHCPTSNAKLASGIARVPDLVAAGVNVSIGTDGAPCQNTCDLLQELKLAAIVQRSVSHNPSLFRAETILEMGTINGARALGLADQIGSLEVKKRADFVALDMRKPHLQPCINPVSNVVYSATGRDVSVVVVDGQLVVDRGKLLTMDEEAIIEAAKQKSCSILERADLMDQIRSIWPVSQSR
ncbi:hypothetical protein ETB97_009345 [Aspergillus alliaceus]|uniref:Atrazine chlorohydrolase/guanine deaminase n=1 Tax=Petromyces alliaceus TaxID=209559 RepID=A0A5N7C4T1_PETAA|nr:atrazine chlorohydrolase/guanine deaminase [Aspergillus alliaceus]KAF5855370.1 hypothetical protein ETB97_009345 [Aspergillus burnettii]